MTGDANPSTGPQLARAVLDAARARRDLGRHPARGRARVIPPVEPGLATAAGGPVADGPVADSPAVGGRPEGAPPAGASTGSGGSGAGLSTGPGSPARPGRARRARPRGYSGSGPDPRDPQPFGVILQKMLKTRGWQRPAAEARIFAAWERVAGTDIAAHCRPVRLDGTELTVEAESTAWATQLRLLSGRLLGRIGAETGHNVVTRLNIHGPTAPSWSRGARRISGRGPRDTYG